MAVLVYNVACQGKKKSLHLRNYFLVRRNLPSSHKQPHSHIHKNIKCYLYLLQTSFSVPLSGRTPIALRTIRQLPNPSRTSWRRTPTSQPTSPHTGAFGCTPCLSPSACTPPVLTELRSGSVLVARGIIPLKPPCCSTCSRPGAPQPSWIWLAKTAWIGIRVFGASACW